MASKKFAVYLRTINNDGEQCEEYYLDTPRKGALPDGTERVTKPSTERTWQRHWCEALNAAV
jgi:hypothetical protein